VNISGGAVDEQVLPTPWTQLNRAEIEALTRKAYLSFYVRPKYILMMIRRLESIHELMRYVRVFFQLLLRPIRPQQGKRMPFLVKCARCSFAFLEGIIATIAQGTRHPVAAYGGGLKGAWALARHEWKRSTTLKDLSSPGNAEENLLDVNVKKELLKQECSDFPNRYIPQSSGALGSADRKKASRITFKDTADQLEIS